MLLFVNVTKPIIKYYYCLMTFIIIMTISFFPWYSIPRDLEIIIFTCSVNDDFALL
jgi:hypothetical protein